MYLVTHPPTKWLEGVLVHVGPQARHASQPKTFHIEHKGVETAGCEDVQHRVAELRPRDWNSGHHDLFPGTASPAESSAIFPIFPTPGTPNRLRVRTG